MSSFTRLVRFGFVVVLFAGVVACGSDGSEGGVPVPVVSFQESDDQGLPLSVDRDGGSSGLNDREGLGLPGIGNGSSGDLDLVKPDEGSVVESGDDGGVGAASGVGGPFDDDDGVGGDVVVVVDSDGVVVSGGLDSEAGVVLDGFGNVVFDGVVVDLDGNVVVDGETGVYPVCGNPGPKCLRYVGSDPLQEGGPLVPPSHYLTSTWDPWVGQVLDMCNDHEALTAMQGEFWDGPNSDIDYSVFIDSGSRASIDNERRSEYIICSDAEAEAFSGRWWCFGRDDRAALNAYLGGFDEDPESSVAAAWAEANNVSCEDVGWERRRYVYMTYNGPLQPQRSVEAAIQSLEDYKEFYRKDVSVYPWRLYGPSMGTTGSWGIEPGLRADEVVVVDDTVTVIDGVVRGLVQNRSWRLWARDAVVSVVDPSGVVLEWPFVLTIQPGEDMPFEIEGWTGTNDPSDIDFIVTADLSPTIDLSRSLQFETMGQIMRGSLRINEETGLISLGDISPSDEFKSYYPEEIFKGQIYPEDVYERDDIWSKEEVSIKIKASRDHPRLAEAASNQTVENLTIIATRSGQGEDYRRVIDVFEITPMYLPNSFDQQWTEIHHLEPGRAAYVIWANTEGFSGYHLWAGSPNQNTQRAEDHTTQP